jgi:hypothetical protein
MKQYSPLIALTLLAGCLTLSTLSANAQDDEKGAFERKWYDTCYQKRDEVKCYQLSKELIEKYPDTTYRGSGEKNIKAFDQKKALEKFQAALTAFYTPPQSVAKLEQLFTAGDEYLVLQPGQQFVIGQMARAGAFSAMGELAYKNLGKVKGYAETALKTFQSAAAPEGWKKEEWEPLREIVQAQMNQFLGWQLIVPEEKGDENLALDYLTRATQVKSNDGVGWKDPYNYVLRSIVYNSRYSELRKPYDAMDDITKLSDAGKEALKKVNDLLDNKLIPEYARVLATATSPETRTYAEQVKSTFDTLWDYRTGAMEKAADYIKSYMADPTIDSIPIPVKADDSASSAPAPTTTPDASKLQAAKPGMDAGGKSPAAANGGKATPAKGKAKPKPRRRR